MLEPNLHPLVALGAPGGSGPPDVALNIAITFNPAEGLFNINGVDGFTPPPVPVLLQIISGARTAQELLGSSVFVVPPNSVIEVSIPGGTPGFPVCSMLSYALANFLILLYIAPDPSARRESRRSNKEHIS